MNVNLTYIAGGVRIEYPLRNTIRRVNYNTYYYSGSFDSYFNIIHPNWMGLTEIQFFNTWYTI